MAVSRTYEASLSLPNGADRARRGSVIVPLVEWRDAAGFEERAVNDWNLCLANPRSTAASVLKNRVAIHACRCVVSEPQTGQASIVGGGARSSRSTNVAMSNRRQNTRRQQCHRGGNPECCSRFT